MKNDSRPIVSTMYKYTISTGGTHRWSFETCAFLEIIAIAFFQQDFVIAVYFKIYFENEKRLQTNCGPLKIAYL